MGRWDPCTTARYFICTHHPMPILVHGEWCNRICFFCSPFVYLTLPLLFSLFFWGFDLLLPFRDFHCFSQIGFEPAIEWIVKAVSWKMYFTEFPMRFRFWSHRVHLFQLVDWSYNHQSQRIWTFISQVAWHYGVHCEGWCHWTYFDWDLRKIVFQKAWLEE